MGSLGKWVVSFAGSSRFDTLGCWSRRPDGFTLARATGRAQPPPPTIASPKHLKASSLVATPVKALVASCQVVACGTCRPQSPAEIPDLQALSLSENGKHLLFVPHRPLGH